MSHDAHFWRRLAHLGATRGPNWLVEYSPAFFGLAAAALVPEARRSVSANLRRIRGDDGTVKNAVAVAQTFANYAACLAEVLSAGSSNARVPEAEVHGELHLARAMREERGIVFATAHTAGWEIVGPLLGRDHALDVMMVMQAERDPAARALQDEARLKSGVRVAHVGDDPLASLALLHHLRRRGVVALQLDRVPPGIRSRAVRLFGRQGSIPEGPLRLAQAARAPVVPIFCARIGFRRYRVEISAPIFLRRRAPESEVDAAAQGVADAMTRFISAHPTHWFHFSG